MPKIYFKINATLLVMNNLRNQETLTKFGIRLKEIRNRRGLTLEQLAFDADIELSQVHRVEKGKINPTLTTLIALAKGLRITLAELVGE
jgi:transcriptional regulator with XRE-family HTH domain